MDDKPTVTIGMPVYNGARTLGAAIDSLLAQTYTDFKMIISDNASTDETEAFCRHYQESDSRVHFHRNESTIEAIANWSQVLAMADTPLFMWAAADDTWSPEFLQELVSLLESNPHSVLAFSQAEDVNLTTGETHPYRSLMRFSKPRSRVARMALFLLSPGSSGKANMIYGVIRRDVLERNEGMYWGTDEWSPTMITLFLLARAGTFSICDRVLFHKGFIPFLSIEQVTVCSFGDILGHYRLFRRIIAENRGSFGETVLLQAAALENLLRSLGANIVEKALIRLNSIDAVRTIYRRLRPNVPA